MVNQHGEDEHFVEDHYLQNEIISLSKLNFGSFKGRDISKVTDVACTVFVIY